MGGLLALSLLAGAYFSLRYTVVAEVAESFSAVDENDPFAYGETLFGTRGCSGCHTLQKAGATGDTGPNLAAVQGRSTDYIRTSITAPNAVIAQGCPEEPCEAGVMPNYGRILNETQIDALVTYLKQ